ncbi:MAG: VCBS repeat-containing protein, partial [Planctomycetota bacterium]
HDNAVGSVIHVLRNRSDGSFDQAGQLTIGTAAITDLELADLDGDGGLDLALHLLTESFVRVLKNQGDGSFVAAGTYASGGATDRLATGDVDGDGDQDVVAINYFFNPPESELAVLLNDGQGAFAAPKTYAVGGAVRDLVLSDVDRDSDLDAAIAVTDLGRMSIMKNLGGGVFGGKVDYAIGMSPFVVTAADLDADGDDDLASVGVGTDLTDLVVLRNQGTGSFAIEGYPVGQSGEVPNAIIARDIDREHGVDLLVVTDTGAHLQRNQGDGIFVRLTYFGPDTRLQAGKAADLDRDGDQDVIASPYNDDSLLVLHNDGHGTFTKVQEQTVNGTDLRLALADLNRDGDVDCVAKVRTTREVAVLLNRGDGTLDDPASYVTGRGLADIALGDLDGDGDVDVVTAHSESTPPTLKAVGVLHNLGDGTLAGESLVWSANSGVIRVVLGDLDLDGDLDIIASQDGAFAWLRNDGQGNFPSVALIPTLRYLSALTIADVDRDPYPDVIAVGADTNPGNWATVHLNHGDETFGRSDYPAKLPSDVTVADVDNDLNLDLIVSGPDEVSVFFNAGDGTFGLEHLFGALEYCRSTMTGDFDGDGLMDAAAVGGSNVVGYAKGLWLLWRREDVR